MGYGKVLDEIHNIGTMNTGMSHPYKRAQNKIVISGQYLFQTIDEYCCQSLITYSEHFKNILLKKKEKKNFILFSTPLPL